MHCQITHLIANKSTALTKVASWPFIGRVDNTRGRSPSLFPCQWPAVWYLDVPENLGVARSTLQQYVPRPPPPRMLPPPGPRPAVRPQSWLDLPAEFGINLLIGGHDCLLNAGMLRCHMEFRYLISYTTAHWTDDVDLQSSWSTHFKLDISLAGWRECFRHPCQPPCRHQLTGQRLYPRNCLFFLNREGGSRPFPHCCGTIWGKIASFDISMVSYCRVAARVAAAGPREEYVEMLTATARQSCRFLIMRSSSIKMW